jgi:hypothetical protein
LNLVADQELAKIAMNQEFQQMCSDAAFRQIAASGQLAEAFTAAESE